MSESRFSVDVDPAAIRHVGTWLTQLSEVLEESGHRVAGMPGVIGDRWQGNAAEVVKGEMTGLGGLMTGTYPTRLTELAGEAEKLATVYETALETVVGLNTRWTNAEDDVQHAVDVVNRLERHQLEGDEVDPDVLEAKRRDLVHAQGLRNRAHSQLTTAFTELREDLATATARFGRALSASAPVEVPAETVANFNRNGYSPDLRVGDGALLAELELTTQYRVAELRGEVAADVGVLEEALVSGDHDAVLAALGRITSRGIEPHYPQALVQALGGQGVHDLYGLFEQHLSGSRLDASLEVLEGMNDVIAAGIEALSSSEYVGFLGLFLDAGGARYLGVVAASAQAGEQLATTALALHTRIVEASDPRTPFLDNLTYALEPASGYVADWEVKASGAVLADILANADGDLSAQILGSLLSPTSGGRSVPGSELEARVGLYGELLATLRDQTGAEKADSDLVLGDQVAQALQAAERLLGTGEWALVQPHIRDLLTDPDTVRWWLNHSLKVGDEDPRSASALQRWMKAADISADEIIHAVREGHNPSEPAMGTAEMLGVALGIADLLGEQNADWQGIITDTGRAIVKEAIGQLKDNLGKKSLVVGPIVTAIESLEAEFRRINELDTRAAGNLAENAVNEQMAFYAYVADNDEVPQGYASFLEANPHLVDDPGAINEYFKHIRRHEDPDAEELRAYDAIIRDRRGQVTRR